MDDSPQKIRHTSVLLACNSGHCFRLKLFNYPDVDMEDSSHILQFLVLNEKCAESDFFRSYFAPVFQKLTPAPGMTQKCAGTGVPEPNPAGVRLFQQDLDQDQVGVHIFD